MLRGYLVTVDKPEGVTDVQMAEYIKRALHGWSGQIAMGETLVNLDRNSISVRNQGIKPRL